MRIIRPIEPASAGPFTSPAAGLVEATAGLKATARAEHCDES